MISVVLIEIDLNIRRFFMANKVTSELPTHSKDDGWDFKFHASSVLNGFEYLGLIIFQMILSGVFLSSIENKIDGCF